MTMLDDDRLAALLGRTAAAFEVPASGPHEILARAAGAPAAGEEGNGVRGDVGDGETEDSGGADVHPLPRGRRLVAVADRHRLLAVAACLVVALVLAGSIGALTRGPSTLTATRLGVAKPAAGSGGVRLPATTLPSGDATHGGTPPFSAQKGLGSSAQAAGGTAQATGGTSAPNAPGLPQGAVGQSAKIEQSGSLNLTVGRGNLARTMTRLTGLAGATGGFVASSQSQGGSGGAPEGTIMLQVPVAAFSSVLQQAEHLGKASDVSTKATDVTGQYVDLQARVSALEATRQQYLTILAKATSIGDILSVQEQLDGIQTQIEQLQGQLEVLGSETSYSTLTVTIGEGSRPGPPKPSPLPESGIVQAWHASVGGFITGVEGVVRLAGPFLFALLCLALVVIGGRLGWRRYQRHRL